MTKNDVCMSTVKIYAPGTFVQFINSGRFFDDHLIDENLPSGMITKVIILEGGEINYLVTWWSGDDKLSAWVSELEFIVL